MTESNPSLPPADKKTSPKAKTGKNSFAIFLSILTLILLGISVFYFWQQQTLYAQKIQQLIANSQGDSQKLNTYQQSIQQQVSSLNELSNKQQTLLNSLAQESYFHTQKLSDLGARSRNDWLLAEAEYLMHLANQRLTLEQDILGAEAMLTSADKVISEINDPGLIEIRRTLASEIVSLQQVSHLDYQGLYLKLNALIESLDGLQQGAFLRENLPKTEHDNEATIESKHNPFVDAWASIWQDLKQAVLIRRVDQPVAPLLAPEQDYYLKQNLRLMLEQASLALIDKNTLVYQTSLNKALSWLNQYFIDQDKKISELKRALSEMSQFKIDQTLPDISNSLRLTKAKIESFYRQHSIQKLSTPDAEIEAMKANTENNDTGTKL